MAVNADRPHAWKADVAQSVQCYNDWFVHDAPRVYHEARLQMAERIEAALHATANLTAITPDALRQHPNMLSWLRMAATPPISRERLAGLAQVSPTLLTCMERDGHVPPHLIESVVDTDLQRIGEVLMRLADRDIFPWLENGYHLVGSQIHRAALIVADRLCLSAADAIPRDAQKQSQITALRKWLERHGYAYVETTKRWGLDHMALGTFAFDLHVPILLSGRATQASVPIDVAIMPLDAGPQDMPLLIETRCAGDFTRGAKKRGEDGAKMAALRSTYGPSVRFMLLLWGYFDTGYLGYVAAEDIDWVWQHRIDDLKGVAAAASPAIERPVLNNHATGAAMAAAAPAGRRW